MTSPRRKGSPASGTEVALRPPILIVDDRPENLFVTEAVLRPLKATIFQAASGAEALQLMREHRFAVVLLDVQMPGMDGFETAQQMQQHESMRGVPIIFVTALSREDKFATQAAEIGAVDYIFKPINPDILCSKVKVYLDLFVQKEEILRLNEGLRHSNAELERLAQIEQQLRQSQKMEAIGSLTGGMAHDFNNLLGIIIGNLDLVEEERNNPEEVRRLSQAALHAALRGADLTRRLLAFARQQPLMPQRIDINRLTEGITQLLHRTLGEDIEIVLDLAPDLWPTVADPAQLEAAITNLANNARDAMRHGGKLLITTYNTHIDADYVSPLSEVTPGEYVAIEVSDSGTGIPPELLPRIFEPFFSTKARDKGTGLGLSMVFGFIKQSGGHIGVYSEVGVGTTFRLYLPRTTAPTETPSSEKTAAPIAKGGPETILVVEDNMAMRLIATRLLRDLGYQVLEAPTADDALDMLDKGAKIDLLFTDIVMPGKLNGIDLARTVRTRWPGLKVVFTSGFPENKFDEMETLRGSQLISKPYRRQELARVLREVLES